MSVTSPNPWPVPDAAVEAGGHAAAKCDGHIYAGWSELPEHRRCDYRRNARAAILAALPLLGIAELLEEADFTIRLLRAELKANGIIPADETIDPVLRNLRDADARMKGEG